MSRPNRASMLRLIAAACDTLPTPTAIRFYDDHRILTLDFVRGIDVQMWCAALRSAERIRHQEHTPKAGPRQWLTSGGAKWLGWDVQLNGSDQLDDQAAIDARDRMALAR